MPIQQDVIIMNEQFIIYCKSSGSNEPLGAFGNALHQECITESVDSVCRDTTYTQYMLIQKNLSKSQKRYTY